MRFYKSDKNQNIAFTEKVAGCKLGRKTSAKSSLWEVPGNWERGILRLCFKNKTFDEGNLHAQYN